MNGGDFMLVKNASLFKFLNDGLPIILKHPVEYEYKDSYLQKFDSINALNEILSGKAYSSNVRMMYFQFDCEEYVALIISDRAFYKNLITCVTADSIPTMIKEAINDLLPYF